MKFEFGAIFGDACHKCQFVTFYRMWTLLKKKTVKVIQQFICMGRRSFGLSLLFCATEDSSARNLWEIIGWFVDNVRDWSIFHVIFIHCIRFLLKIHFFFIGFESHNTFSWCSRKPAMWSTARLSIAYSVCAYRFACVRYSLPPLLHFAIRPTVAHNSR